MNFEYVDNIYRSRVTLLNILEERGYNVDELRKFSPAEISVAVDALSSLGFTVSKKENPSATCQVEYSTMTRPKLEKFIMEFVGDNETMSDKELIIMIRDQVVANHHAIALSNWISHKLKVTFFSIPNLVFDPRTHVLVPTHEIVSQDEHKKILEEWNLVSTKQMPMIRYHIDPIVRVLGAVPGDIIRITRPSPSAGTYVFYRVVST